jgi:hypothetical protein
MVKRILVCSTCGWDWFSWACGHCRGQTSMRVSEAVMRQLRKAYDDRQEPEGRNHNDDA